MNSSDDVDYIVRLGEGRELVARERYLRERLIVDRELHASSSLS